MDCNELRKILGVNFIGPEEIELIHKRMNIISPLDLKIAVPEIPYPDSMIREYKSTHILFLGIPFHSDGSAVTLHSLRNHFGTDPVKSEPCFYNQDWYLQEPFINTSFTFGWYLMSKSILDETRGVGLQKIGMLPSISNIFPSAILVAYYFFLYYFHAKGDALFKNDYIWCSDKDSNQDSIYVGRYLDLKGLNKNGFEIHRHLSLKSNYGALQSISS